MKLHFWHFLTFSQFKNWFLAIFEITKNGFWLKINNTNVLFAKKNFLLSVKLTNTLIWYMVELHNLVILRMKKISWKIFKKNFFVKLIYLISRVFLAWTFFNFLAHWGCRNVTRNPVPWNSINGMNPNFCHIWWFFKVEYAKKSNQNWRKKVKKSLVQLALSPYFGWFRVVPESPILGTQ